MSSRLYIEPIASENLLREGATETDIRFVESFGSERRRREALAWRAIVRRELGREVTISYDEYGAPIVSTPNVYIGVSHCRDLVAVVISDAPCAVDIEERGRNFEGVSERYMTPQERVLSADRDWPAKVWCIKEALYKLYRRGNLEIKNDISVVSYSPTLQLVDTLLPDGSRQRVSVRVQGEHIIAIIE